MNPKIEETRRDQLSPRQQPEEPLGPSIFFSNAAIKLSSVKKAKKSLPKSPRGKREVIRRLASKFQVRVKFGEKVGRKKSVLNEEVDWVIAFLNQRDISYTNLGRKDNVHVGTLKQKRYLLWAIREIFEIMHGSKLLESSEGDNF